MVKIISDSTKFKEIKDSMFAYTLKVEDKINRFLRKLKNAALISDEIYSNLFVSGSSPGILYGLPKVHKPNFAINYQMRPIFAAYSTPSYQLA